MTVSTISNYLLVGLECRSRNVKNQVTNTDLYSTTYSVHCSVRHIRILINNGVTTWNSLHVEIICICRQWRFVNFRVSRGWYRHWQYCQTGCEVKTGYRVVGMASMSCSPLCIDGDNQTIFDKPIDVFISYRRSTGSQLARCYKPHQNELSLFSTNFDNKLNNS